MRFTLASLACISLAACSPAKDLQAPKQTEDSAADDAASRPLPASTESGTMNNRIVPAMQFDFPDCATLQKQSEDSVLAEFERKFPKAIIGEESVETVELSAADMTAVTGYLACVSGAANLDPFVADNALSLFSSKRHGAAAFAALDDLAASNAPGAQEARAFAAQMREYVKGPAE
jgi:hypothetical protein